MSHGTEPFDDVLPHEQDDVLPHEDAATEDERELAEKRPRLHSPLPPPRPYSRTGVGIGFSRSYDLIRKSFVWLVLLVVLYVHLQCCGMIPMIVQMAHDAGGTGLAEAAGLGWVLFVVVTPLVLAFVLRCRLAEWLGFTGLNASFRRMESAIARSFRVSVQGGRRVGIVFGTARQYPPGEYEEYLGLLEIRSEELVLWWYQADTIGVFPIPRSAVTHFGKVEHWYDVHKAAVRPHPDPFAPLLGYTDPHSGQTRWFSLESGEQVAPDKIAAATGALYRELERWVEGGGQTPAR